MCSLHLSPPWISHLFHSKGGVLAICTSTMGSHHPATSLYRQCEGWAQTQGDATSPPSIRPCPLGCIQRGAERKGSLEKLCRGGWLSDKGRIQWQREGKECLCRTVASPIRAMRPRFLASYLPKSDMTQLGLSQVESEQAMARWAGRINMSATQLASFWDFSKAFIFFHHGPPQVWSRIRTPCAYYLINYSTPTMKCFLNTGPGVCPCSKQTVYSTVTMCQGTVGRPRWYTALAAAMESG